ncbi:Gfo/Idh/MocA family oxidoreductase [Bradyrhizobium sp. 18BD]
MTEIRIGLVGAGAIGRAHVTGALAQSTAAKGVKICGIADPSPAAKALADEFGIPHFVDDDAMRATVKPDGVVIATPNWLHVPMALRYIADGIPVLVEKPISDAIEDGYRLSEAAANANVPLLVGHHRRHNPILRHARGLVQSGALGTLVSVGVLAAFRKADAYFDVTWRRAPGGGPVLINLIHEIDLLRFVCGEINTVQAVTSNAVRGFAVEDTAAVVIQFVKGALGTIMLSDAATSPWSWDLTSGENANFPKAAADSHFISGTQASVSLPSLTLWRYAGDRGDWTEPLIRESVAIAEADPYAEQIRHFAAVIRREEDPLTTGHDATRTLEATLAVKQAAQTHQLVRITPFN